MSATKPRIPRIIVIGAGSRGNAYARVVHESGDAIVAAVCEPDDYKRASFGAKYIWGSGGKPSLGSEFSGWEDYLKYELERRKNEKARDGVNGVNTAGEGFDPGVDAAFICTLDHTHRPIIEALSPLGLHIMCEKPLATSLEDCLAIWKSMRPWEDKRIFSIGHVLRYSPHNMILRNLVLKAKAIGDVVSVEHTEPVGWWHFSHSYVRGHWRKESTSAPSLLTKSCHDIDFLMWLLTSPIDPLAAPHLPSSVSSTGSLSFFRKSRKPPAAGDATNCRACPIEETCAWSAKNIYLHNHLERMNTGWPVKIVVPEIESCESMAPAREKLLTALEEDYDSNTPKSKIESRPWFGRCVWESDNDVCDDQTVTLTWDEEDLAQGKGPKRAQFHMTAFTQAQCDRRGRIYGTEGEISYDSFTIEVYNFSTREVQPYKPKQMGGGHGGGDAGLAGQFVNAVKAVMNEEMGAVEAQRKFVGCTLEDVVRSHAVVFAAEEARRENKVVKWGEWWKGNVESVVES